MMPIFSAEPWKNSGLRSVAIATLNAPPTDTLGPQPGLADTTRKSYEEKPPSRSEPGRATKLQRTHDYNKNRYTEEAASAAPVYKPATASSGRADRLVGLGSSCLSCVAGWKSLLPCPGGRHNRFQAREPRRPPQLTTDLI